MIVAYYFRVGPLGGPLRLVRVLPRRYAIGSAAPIRPDRDDGVPADLDPCAVEHACDVCDARTLDATAGLGDDALEQRSPDGPFERWWPSCVLARLERLRAGAGAELIEGVGHAELCPSCYARHGEPHEWPDELLDRVYGPDGGPERYCPGTGR